MDYSTIGLLSLDFILLRLLFVIIRNYFRAGLNRYPVPLLANFTNLWHWLDVRSNQHHHHLVDLHRNLGPIVRIGPEKLSIASPDFVPRIYGSSKGFLKSNMYDAFATLHNGEVTYTSLATQDPAWALHYRKPIAAAFSVNAVAVYEPTVDQMIDKFISRLRAIVQDPGEAPPDMALWSRLYAHDVILHLTFGNTLGFMDAGADIDGFISKLDANLDRAALADNELEMSTMPWTAYWLKLNPVVGFFSKNSHVFVPWALKRIQQRIAERKQMYGGTKRTNAVTTTDYLDVFLDAAATPDEPSGYDFGLLVDWTLVNVMAGADTTAIELRAVLWFLLKDPPRKEKLMQELLGAKLSVPVSWKQSQQLPYLDACIKEALRLCPAIGHGPERKVPKAGLEMPDGYVLPEGTNVGMNAWVVNRQTVFGEDPDEFVPERWLQQRDESVEQHRN
ncbi:MAG: hypothetical protein Q9169_007372, partial [Polycauliona sp. 2 TL-2023]